MAIKKFKVMASNAKKKAKSDGSCIPKSMRKDVKSGCTKKSVKASDTAKKFRVDIYKKDNPDALVKREVKTFNSEDEAKKYGESIANGDIVNVIEVKASRTKKSVKASSDDEFANMLNSVKYHVSFNKGADLIFDNRVVSSNKRDIGHILDKYKVDDVVVDVYRDKAGKRDLQRMQDAGVEIQEEFLGEDPSNSELPPHDFYQMVRSKKSVKSSKSLTVPKSKRKSVKANASAKSVKKFGVKASALAKRKAKQRITAEDELYSHEIFIAFTEHGPFAEGVTLNDCIKNMFGYGGVEDPQDILEYPIWVKHEYDNYLGGKYTDSGEYTYEPQELYDIVTGKRSDVKSSTKITASDYRDEDIVM